MYMILRKPFHQRPPTVQVTRKRRVILLLLLLLYITYKYSDYILLLLCIGTAGHGIRWR